MSERAHARTELETERAAREAAEKRNTFLEEAIRAAHKASDEHQARLAEAMAHLENVLADAHSQGATYQEAKVLQNPAATPR